MYQQIKAYSQDLVFTTCQNCKKDFKIESDDFKFYEKIKVPAPTFCFDCRIKRKLAFLNERTLFKNKCRKCSKSIISMYSPESAYNIFCTSCYNDRDDLFEYGVDYDFFKTFFEQFDQLWKKVPCLHLAHKNSNGERCEYANHVYHGKNVYLSYEVASSEDILYSKQVLEGNKICLDCEIIHFNERAYELFGSTRNYNSRFLIRSSTCVDSAFLFNCQNCTDCFMSSNLRNKSYVFRNQQLSREEYLKVMKEFPLYSYAIQEKCKMELWKLSQNTICRFSNNRNIENCTGDYLDNSKNAFYCFTAVDIENSKYITFGTNTIRDSYDLIYVGKIELCYELANSGARCNKAIFGLDNGSCFDTNYCVSCNNSKNLFGCVGLKNKEYCILNKQYTKEQYEKLLPKIIEQMNNIPYVDKCGIVYKYGEFFPFELSPYSYNESLAYEEFPMTKEEVIKNGYEWRDVSKKEYEPTIESNKLPDSINDVTKNILEEIIACPNKGKVDTKCTFAYRIMPDELRFYQLMKIPLPHYCPNCRYYERRKWKNPWKLWGRTCMCDKENHFHCKDKCEVEFDTSYSPNRPEIIYCEKCYQQEVY
jgi:hypothetical protein